MEPDRLRKYDVEVTWTFRLEVQATSKKDAEERGLDAAVARSLSGGAPDSEDVDVEGPEDDEDE